MTLREGEILDGKYRIVRQIGAGGMGAVFLGENMRVRKTVAIKVLHAGAGGVEDAVQRFEREAQAAGQIGSDHIVEVFDLGRTPAGDHFMVMEYLDGESLRQRIQRGRAVEPSVVAPIVCQMLDGLGAAHAAGIIHRDLKPDNVFILREKAGRRDFVKILDFGISKFLQIGGDGAVTRTGMVMGSPSYMSPEQVKSSNDVDARSDLYTVGVILYEAVTGHVPFKANTFAELLFKIVYEPLPDPRTLNPSVDDAFARLIVKACAAKREDRFQSAAEFKSALLPFVSHGNVNANAMSMQQAAAGTPMPPRALPPIGPPIGPPMGPPMGPPSALPVRLPPGSAPGAGMASPSAGQGMSPALPMAPAPFAGLAGSPGVDDSDDGARTMALDPRALDGMGGSPGAPSLGGTMAVPPGFGAQASQSGGGFGAQASQSGGRFSSTLGPAIGAVAVPAKKSPVGLLVALAAALVVGGGVIALLLVRSGSTVAPAGVPGVAVVVETAQIASAATPVVPPVSPPAASSAAASSAVASSAPKDETAPPATASVAQPTAAVKRPPSERPVVRAPSTGKPEGAKPTGSDVLGY